MRGALHSSVVSIDQQQKRKSTTRIPSISQLNNFQFNSDGVLCRRAFGVGPGHFIPGRQFKDSVAISGFWVSFDNLSNI